MPPHLCPNEGELTKYCLGSLPIERIDEVADHLDTCTSCADRLTGLVRKSDPLAEAIRQAGHVQAYSATVTPPTTLRDYRIESVLGEGGMGTVYRAMHTRLGRPVALKLLTASRRLDPDASARFEREMRAIGALRHPNIVHATDAGEVDGVPFLVMELLDGRDLGRLVSEQGTLSVSEACEVIRQAALGLQHAHEHGLVHRDVKPSNVMLTADGTVKLLDLGLARNAATGETGGSSFDTAIAGMSDLTDPNTRVGTERYMAPEQRSSPEHVGPQADVYALGRTLCYVLHGSPDVPQASALPAALHSILQRMQAENPAERFASASSVAQALEPWTRGENLGALIGQAPKRSRRRVRDWVLGCAIILVGTVTVASIVPDGEQTVTESALATPHPSESALPIPRVVPSAGRLAMTADEAKNLQKIWAAYRGNEIVETNSIGMNLALIPPGEVVIKNVTTVIITKPYQLGTTEVTRAQFRAFVDATNYRTDSQRLGGGKYIKIATMDGKGLRPYEQSGANLSWRTPGYDGVTDTDPVTQVSWNDAVAFCKWLSEREGKQYRLPTVGEATWASRAGAGTDQPGDIVGRVGGLRLDEFAWTQRKTPLQPQPVGKLLANAWGLYDTVGNTAEWCQDRYGQTPGGAHIDYAGPPTGMLRVLIGGSYTNQGAYGWLEPNTPDARSSKTGFRVLREP